MSKKLRFVPSVMLTVTLLLTACSAAAATTTALTAPATAPVPPTTAPAAIAAAPTTTASQPVGLSIKVGLVTDTDGVNDHVFNQLAWEGLQKASKDMGFQAKFIESKQPTDYEK